jgi:hypothetical protein
MDTRRMFRLGEPGRPRSGTRRDWPPCTWSGLGHGDQSSRLWPSYSRMCIIEVTPRGRPLAVALAAAGPGFWLGRGPR